MNYGNTRNTRAYCVNIIKYGKHRGRFRDISARVKTQAHGAIVAAGEHKCKRVRLVKVGTGKRGMWSEPERNETGAGNCLILRSRPRIPDPHRRQCLSPTLTIPMSVESSRSRLIPFPLTTQSRLFPFPLSTQSRRFPFPLSPQSRRFPSPLSAESRRFPFPLSAESRRFLFPLSAQSRLLPCQGLPVNFRPIPTLAHCFSHPGFYYGGRYFCSIVRFSRFPIIYITTTDTIGGL